MSGPTPGIEVEGLGFSYPGGAPVLSDVSFSVAPGDFVALMGPNGSGKTTLIKLLLRLLEPHAGTIRLDGRPLQKLSAAELYQNIGMVFQNPSDQLFAPTVEEDVAFGPRNLKLPPADVQVRVDEALAAVEADHLRQRPIHHLSFGEQRRVCLAGVLAMRPTVLLMDEPTAGLDPNCERHMVQLLAQGSLERIFGDPELIERAGLRLPLVSQLFRELREDGVAFETMPLTIGKARRMLVERLAGRAEAPNPKEGN